MRIHGKDGNYKCYVISTVRGRENNNKPYTAVVKGSSSPLDGVSTRRTVVALGAREVDDGLVHENGLTKYEGSMVHRALHHRRVPKRKKPNSGKYMKSAAPTGVAAGVLKVRLSEGEVVCDIITLEGIKESKTIKQLQAKYDVHGPIKGRIRSRSMRKCRALRILGDEEQSDINDRAKTSGRKELTRVGKPSGSATISPMGDKGSEEVDGGLQEDLPVAHPNTIRILPTARYSQVPLRPVNTTFDASTFLRPLSFASSATSNEKNKEPGGGGKTLEDAIRDLERELEEARRAMAGGRGKLPGGDPPDGAYKERGSDDGGGEGGNTEGDRVGSSSRFPRRGYPK